ncbi:MAG: zinc ribbon domain-containing protein [Actinomycetia bacterium]|nr:zinc ribbon domain-containing protein [Actinomycetes bacterium]
MAGTNRKRSRTWHFADAGSRFDAAPRTSSRDRDAISPTFSHKIIRCRRCGSRIFGNARRCPYCGKSVIPFYRSLVFWSGIVALLAACMIYFIFFFNPQVQEPPANGSARPPVALGIVNPDGSALEGTANLPLGTTVDCNDLLITVIAIQQPYTTADGTPIYEITVQFLNKSSQRQNLLTTQWLMQTVDGSSVEVYKGNTSDGTNLASGVEGRQLATNELYTTHLYFATAYPLSIEFLLNPLDTKTGPVVSWAADYGSTGIGIP